ncbi:MAG: ATP-binding protein [Burkholderiales bacterium]|nr:ATP-binding protein [Burkholderiales bacterium]
MAKGHFINRKDELKNLKHGLMRGQDYILIAPRRFGKTVLAKRVLEEISQDNNYLIIHIDLMFYSGGSIKSIAEGIINKCLNALGISGKLRQLWHQVDFSVNLKLNYKGLELEPIIRLFKESQGEDEWRLLEEALELPQKIAHQKNKKVIVFYDEFGEVDSFSERAVKVFRSVLQHHEEVSYLFAGSQETLMNKIFLDKLGAFYRFGELIYLKELTKADIFIYIAEICPYITPEIISEMLDLLKGHPYYTSLVIEHFISNSEMFTDVSSFYKYIRTVLIPQEEAYLELQVLKIKERVNALDIMRILSLGLNPYTEFQLKEQQVYSILRILEVSGYIRKESRGRYTITDPLLQFFLLD